MKPRQAIVAQLFLAVAVYPCASLSSVLPSPTQEVADGVLRVALPRALVEPGDLPDYSLLRDETELVVRSEIPNSSFVITAKGLPEVKGWTVRALPEDRIRSLAASRSRFYFVAVSDLRIQDDQAEMWIGVEVMTSPARPVLCCCAAKVRYRRVDDSWRYIDSPEFQCS